MPVPMRPVMFARLIQPCLKSCSIHITAQNAPRYCDFFHVSSTCRSRSVIGRQLESVCLSLRQEAPILPVGGPILIRFCRGRLSLLPSPVSPLPSDTGQFQNMTGADPVSVQALEADSDLSDADSAIQSLASSSESITSSILRSREENGRTYHAFREGKYVLPNDEGENERLDLQHHLYTLTFDGKLFTCPAGRDKPIVQALDAGTGTGIWAMDFADDHPETKVVGVDLSPIQPDFYLCVPPNVTFYIDDIEDRWTFSTGFDFIYSRMLTASIKDWPSYIHQCYDNLEPGGWLEISDILLDLKSDDNTVSPASPAAQWGRYMLEAAAKFGRPLDSALFLKQQLADAGFTHIVETIYKWPSNSWPKDPKFKELGMWTYENLGNGASGLSMALFTRALGWTQQEVELFLVDVRRDMKDRSVHGYWPLYVVYGQKPGAND